MPSITFNWEPLATWNGDRTKNPKRSQFKASFNNTLDLLDRELLHLGARQVVIQADVDRADIRLDGMLRANARMKSPAIILSFESRFGPLSYPCDRYDDWRDNLRAIALALEALRAVDRYGVTRRAEQYRGWQRLPSAETNGNAMTRQVAAAILSACSGIAADYLLQNSEALKSAYRSASRATHPDQGGSEESFRKVQAAFELLSSRS